MALTKNPKQRKNNTEVRISIRRIGEILSIKNAPGEVAGKSIVYCWTGRKSVRIGEERARTSEMNTLTGGDLILSPARRGDSGERSVCVRGGRRRASSRRERRILPKEERGERAARRRRNVTPSTPILRKGFGKKRKDACNLDAMKRGGQFLPNRTHRTSSEKRKRDANWGKGGKADL